MTKFWPLFFGVAVILVFSIFPIRYANAFCCLGVIVGGLQGALIRGRGQGFRLEVTHAIRLGSIIGALAAVVTLLLNLGINLWWNGALIFDPIPQFLYTFFLRLIEGIMDIGGNSPNWSTDDGPGLIGRFLFQLPSHVLFGGIGGAIAASLFKQETPISRETQDH
jgi:hypothetical protein